ncbi:MAG TPA: hypothetical protein PLQ87_08290 [Phycisphaerae bacterium]|nr:hypothetical protein [Phycisphaerae bacterium]
MEVVEMSRMRVSVGHHGMAWPAVLGALLLLTGCQGAVVGDWYLVEAIPNRQTFSIDRASFRANGTYAATTTIEGVTTEDKGTYDFNGFKLRLRPDAGGQRAYTTSVQPGQLQLTSGNRKVLLKKGKKGV